jgi:hypothetical protein
MHGNPWRMIVAMFLFCGFAGSAAPRSPSPQNSEVTVTLRLQDGATTFHVGEPISLELTFTSSVGGKYEFCVTNGRDMDGFHVTPAGRDPMQKYLGLFGPFSPWDTESVGMAADYPWGIQEDLNEQVALDKARTLHTLRHLRACFAPRPELRRVQAGAFQ